MNKAVKTLQTLIIQSGHKIDDDGIMGKNTRGSIEQLCMPNWVKTALKEVGTKEIRGKQHNERVLYYHSFTGGYSTDEVAWCGSFIAMVMKVNGYDIPKYAERAKSWLKFGKTSTNPILGSIAVKSRTGGGHVCIVVGKDATGNLYCVGGNQSDEVNIRLYKKEDFIDFRVPTNYSKEVLPYYALAGNDTGSREA